ncbi:MULTISPECIES: ricin-type beta-trefoil lectin domain protein [unclassified Mesorhizobium]|uniref:ricin-type beta-trefoil lectin domain protein n=1 Tax=unclassified Mesorhizobium TaxID=325217 RepID=UPI000A057992
MVLLNTNTPNARLPGSNVIVHSCQQGSNQRWDHTGGQLRSRASGLCLTAHDGAQFTMESCTPGTRNQIWHLPLLPAAPR